MDALTVIDVPDNWMLLRIDGRKHFEVVTHISLDEGDSLACGRSPKWMVFDSANIITPHWTTYEVYGGRPVQHLLCRKCLKKLVQTD